MALHHRRRIRVAIIMLATTAAVFVSVVMQHRWDAECDARVPGSRWNGDLWMCEQRR